MVKNLISKMKNRIVKWLLNEKSNETSDIDAWIFWSIMIGILAVLSYKVGFQNIINTFININKC
jgi:hypothetical protein